MLPWSPTNQVFDSVWLTVLSFEALLFTIAIAFILLAMAKERTEFRHKTAAHGRSAHRHRQPPRFPRRGHFMLSKRQEAEAARPQCCWPTSTTSSRSTIASATRVGDRVLQIFAETARAKLGAVDLIGRLGGEEFAIVIYDCRPRQSAWPLPSAFGSTFETAAADVDGRPIGGTVSMGMVIAETNLFDISALLAQADEALYCAKERGRNRSEVASLQLVLDRAKEAEQRHAMPAR